jgi:hypothetical protein
MSHRPAPSRGNSLLEFALVTPILIALILYSLFFAEIIRAKLKLQEVVRYAAWEVASYPLSDYSKGNPGKSFEHASGQAVRDAEARYAELDSLASRAGDFVGRFEDLHLEIAQTEVPWIDTNALPSFRSAGGAWSQSIFGALASSPSKVLKDWGFNTHGKLRIEASVALNNLLLPRRFFDRAGRGFFHVDFFGGRNLTRIPLRTGLTLIADGWALSDGADSVMKGSRAGQRREGNQTSGLYRQVRRMGFLGIRDRLEHVPAVSSVLGLLHSVAPNPLGTYVVSHNYAPDSQVADSRDCDAPGYPETARGGLNNLLKSSQLDNDRPRCFDTAPFRDQASYQDSLYIQMFIARGNWFMGCKYAQADDPSSDSAQAGGEPAGGRCE